MTTVISFTKPMEDFSTFFSNGAHVSIVVGLSDCTEFWPKGTNSECLIYKGNQIVYSCCYTETFGKNWITSVWSKDGCKFDEPINYDEIELFLYGVNSEVCAICKQASGCDQVPYDCPLCDFKGQTYKFKDKNGRKILAQFKSRENAEQFAERSGTTFKGMKR